MVCTNYSTLPYVIVYQKAYCDYKKFLLPTKRFYNYRDGFLFLRLTPSELSRLIYRFHLWITVTGIVRQMLDFRGSRKRRKAVILSKIRKYRQKGHYVLYSELRKARLNKGAYIPADGPQVIVIGGNPFDLIEIEFENFEGKLSGAVLKLKIQ